MEKLRDIRKKLGLTQLQAAQIIGVSRRTYQTYEERKRRNAKVDEIITKLNEKAAQGNKALILSRKFIKNIASEIFAKYDDVECAYLFGSYARGEATVSSDVDIIIVSKPLGLDFYSLAADLEKALGKPVDLLSHRQLADNAEFLARILKEGVKIFG